MSFFLQENMPIAARACFALTMWEISHGILYVKFDAKFHREIFTIRSDTLYSYRLAYNSQRSLSLFFCLSHI